MSDLRRPFLEKAGCTVVPWEDVYLLGWFTAEGKAQLTSWKGEAPKIQGLYFGYGHPPMWDAPVRGSAIFVTIPEDVEDAQAFANAQGGLLAFGWLFPGEIDRTKE